MQQGGGRGGGGIGEGGSVPAMGEASVLRMESSAGGIVMGSADELAFFYWQPPMNQQPQHQAGKLVHSGFVLAGFHLEI